MDVLEQRKRDPDKLQRENYWYHQTHQIRFGVGPVTLPITVIIFAVLSILQPLLWYVTAFILVLDVIKRALGVKPSHLGRLFRSNRSFWLAPKMIHFILKTKFSKQDEPADRPNFINEVGMLHAHPKWKKRSKFMSVIGALFLVALTQPVTAEAQTRLILPKTDKNELEVSSNLESIPMITRQVIINGFGIDSPLKDVMQQIIPKTWDVRVRSSELNAMPISWRSQDDDLVTLLQDIADRYNVLFRYSNRSGVVFVEWAEQGCRSGQGANNVYTNIC